MVKQSLASWLKLPQNSCRSLFNTSLSISLIPRPPPSYVLLISTIFSGSFTTNWKRSSKIKTARNGDPGRSGNWERGRGYLSVIQVFAQFHAVNVVQNVPRTTCCCGECSH